MPTAVKNACSSSPFKKICIQKDENKLFKETAMNKLLLFKSG